MSRKSHRQAKRSRSARRAGKEVRTEKNRRPNRDSLRRRVWFGVALGAGILALLAWWFPAPQPPEIAWDQLDPPSRRLVEAHYRAVRQAPRSGPAWGKLGAILRSYGFRQEAIDCLEQAESRDPMEPRWPYLHGLLVAVQSPSIALIKFKRTVELCGNNPDAPRLRLAAMLSEHGRWDEAQGQLRRLLESKPDHGLALMGLAQIAVARGDVTNAMNLADRCVRDGRAARAAWSLLANLRMRIGDTAGAQKAAQTAATLPPIKGLLDPYEAEADALRDDPRILSDRAQSFLMAGQTAEASPLVNRLVEAHAEFSETWLLLGRLRILQQDYAAAQQSLRRFVQQRPESAGGWFQLGMALLRQKRFPEAANAFERATQLQPDFGPAYFNLGVCRYQSGQKQEAMAPLQAVTRFNPEYLDAYILLADLHVQLGNTNAAMPRYEQARALDPNDRRLPILLRKITGAKMR